jgi:hypothetical protein
MIMRTIFVFTYARILPTRRSCCVSSRTTMNPAQQRHSHWKKNRLPPSQWRPFLEHEGQFEGRRVRSPVFLGRRPQEPCNRELQSFYTTLLEAIDSPVFRGGHWTLCERTGWPDNSSFQNLVAWTWVKDEDRYLIVVNLSGNSAQARVRMPRRSLRDGTWRLSDLLCAATYDRDGNEMLDPGLYVELGPWKSTIFPCARLHPPDVGVLDPVPSEIGSLVGYR